MQSRSRSLAAAADESRLGVIVIIIMIAKSGSSDGAERDDFLFKFSKND
jgi:hypothetical protein